MSAQFIVVTVHPEQEGWAVNKYCYYIIYSNFIVMVRITLMLHVCLTLSNDVYLVLPSIRLHLRIQFWQVTPAGSLALNDISLDGITGTSTSSVSGIYS